MKTLFALLLLTVLSLVASSAPQPEYAKLKADAERLYSEGSYALARELYEKADGLSLPPADARWVDFRLADTTWRAQAATSISDTTKFDLARQTLEELIRDGERGEGRDIVWAEAHESLGDFWWTRHDSRNWGPASGHYLLALDWWAGERDIARARRRYVTIIKTISQPPGVKDYYYGLYGNYLAPQILENYLKIAATENDKAHAHFLLAVSLRHTASDIEQQARLSEEFTAALKPGKTTDWYDDALYFYGEWLSQAGRARRIDDEGNWAREPDFVKALEVFRRLVREYAKGETRFYEQATNQINEITQQAVGVGVGNIFLPGSEIQFYLNWRNVRQIELNLYKVNLARDVRFAGKDAGSGEWLQQIPLAAGERVKSWSRETKDAGEHAPGNELVRLDAKLPVGAYVLEAKGAQKNARELILVTDASVVLKTTNKQALVLFSNAQTGAPIASANVKLWQRVYNGSKWGWREFARQTGADGLAVFELNASQSHTEVFVVAEQDGQQAYGLNQHYSYNYRESGQPSWRIYAFTDRPAYRPGESMQWKFIARTYEAGNYSTPANQTVEFEIIDPRGTKVKESKTTLNAFGSAWGALELTAAMPLGEYRVQFYDEGRRNSIGSAQLFRLEEYKLPEFKVSIQTPEEAGKKKAFRLGEKVEVKIQAAYYYGGAVGGGAVEVLVYQNPFYLHWSQPREYPWFYEEASSQRNYYGGGSGQIVKRETLKLDAEGKTTLTFDTPRGRQDHEYRIEARVTDQSRREVVNSSSVRVTRQRYYVYPSPAHNIYRPQDEVTIDFKTLDANSQPVAVEGTVRVTRQHWYEIWIDPAGKEIKGEELRRVREREKAFPYAAERGARPWRLKFRGFQQDEILVQTLRTDADGTAQLKFKPEREGYYRVAWRSEVKHAAPIKAETVVWVANNATSELSYRGGGVQIVIDKDTFRAGQTAPVLLTVPTNDSYVLFSVEGDDLYSYRLVHVTGTAKLIELPVEDRHVPNIFLSALMVADRQLSIDTKQIVVPPVKQFLQVDVKADREQYQPREEGTLTVTTRDQSGRGVAAEVALGLIDESVFYIQSDYAGDPRRFYYGSKRTQHVQTQSTFQQKGYAQLVETPDKQLVDIKTLAARRDKAEDEDDSPFSRLGMLSDHSSSPRMDGQREANSPEDLSLVGGVEVTATGGAGLMTNGRAAKSSNAPPPPPAFVPGQSPETAAVQVRSDFRSTIHWQPDIVTGSDGTATVKVKYPDSLTGWQATARVNTAASEFGIASTTTRTKQPLIVRLQAPRFFVVGDVATVSGVINNNTEQPMRVAPALDAEGLTVTGLVIDGKAVKGEAAPVDVAAGGERRVDWLVSVRETGSAKLKVTARGDKYADAMEKEFIVHEHGIEKFINKSGKLRGAEVAVNLRLPKERRTDTTKLTVQVAPSMAVTMLDALPYLVDYPYGCTEQTMSRFLPAAVTAKTLRDLGLRPEEAMDKIFGGIEQKHASQTHPSGKRDLRRLDAMVAQGLSRLYDFQHPDGGWGWWKEGDSDHFMTAYVVWGFTLARGAGIDVTPDALERAVGFLDKEIVEKEVAFDQQAWMLHALSSYHEATQRSERSQFQTTAFDNLWKNRDRLNAYTRALLALSAHHYGDDVRARVLIQNLENGVKIDSAPDISIVQRGDQQTHAGVIGTAHWGEDGIFWRWSDGGVEATSFALRALLAIDPQHKLVEPVTNWLVKNRRGAQWSNTRDTAITVLTLNDYLRVSGEIQPDLEYELLVNGRTITRKKMTAADALTAPSVFDIKHELIRDGDNEIIIRRLSGSAPVYFAAQAAFYSLEEPITATGNEIFVRREYYKLVGRPTLLKGYVYDRQLLKPGDSVRSGERIEAVITVEAKNNYEYLIFEDLKPAGIEAVQLRSGESLHARELKSGAVERRLGTPDGTTAGDARARLAKSSLAPLPNPADPFTGRSRWVYQELRDRKVALFIDKLPEGIWEMRYDFRAEVPGTFHALPVVGHAMYVPEIRCNDQELRLVIEEERR